MPREVFITWRPDNFLNLAICTGDNSTVTKELSLCEPPGNTTATRTQFSNWLVSAYASLAQFDNLAQAFYNFSGSVLGTVISDTLATTSPLSGLNETLWHAYGINAQNGCLSCTVSKASLLNLSTIAFSYAQCSWLPGNVAVDPNSIWSIPGASTSNNLSDTCKALFNFISPLTGAEIKKKYKITQEDIANSTHIILSEGEYDPTTAISVPPGWLGDLEKASPDASVVLQIAGIGHTQDAMAYNPATDGQALVNVSAIG